MLVEIPEDPGYRYKRGSDNVEMSVGNGRRENTHVKQ